MTTKIFKFAIVIAFLIGLSLDLGREVNIALMLIGTIVLVIGLIFPRRQIRR